jgi:cytochrome c2
MMYLRAIFVGFLLIAVAGCATTILQPTPADVQWAQTRWPAVTLEDLQSGRSLYVQKCSTCHHLRNPAKYEPGRWPELLVKMRPKAKINPVEEELLVQYLSTASERARNKTE